jgi:hypothetical protein
MEVYQSEFAAPQQAVTAPAAPLATAADAARDAAIEASVARGEERRRSQRRTYVATHLVAFHQESQSPAENTFQAVRCREISTSGVSFLCDGPPPFDHCTMMLGRHPQLIRVRARVIHCFPFAGPNDQWIVGCNFLDTQSDAAWGGG